jgi:transposase
MERTDLQRLSKDDLIDLALQLQRPKKTTQTSSLPPSLDRKERRENSKPGGGKPGHKGHFHALCQTPDAVRDHVPVQCGPNGRLARRGVLRR